MSGKFEKVYFYKFQTRIFDIFSLASFGNICNRIFEFIPLILLICKSTPFKTGKSKEIG